MANSLKATKHAKQRLNERQNLYKVNSVNKNLRQLQLYGHNISEFYGELYTFLTYKKAHSKHKADFKVYNNYVYVYKGKKVLTCYELPEKLQPYTKWLNRNKPNVNETSRTSNERLKNQAKRKISKEVGDRYLLKVVPGGVTGDFVVSLDIDNCFVCFGQGSTTGEAMNNAVDKYLKSINKETEETCV